MENKTSFGLIVELLQAVNQGKLRFTLHDGLIYVKGNDGEQAVISRGPAVVTLPNSDPMTYPIIHE